MKKPILMALLLAASGSASAHTGHGEHFSLTEGLAHPLGWDHLLAMVAVGIWSAAVLPARRCWLGPMTFVSVMVAAALAARAGMTLPLTEVFLALSVVMFGLMVVLGQRLGVNPGLALMALAAIFHGQAHGMEISQGSQWTAYVLGFALTTALLHAAGLMAGLRLRRSGELVWRLMGTGLAAAGFALLTQA